MTYPVFRKYIDENTFFKIANESEFQEIKRMGNYFSVTDIICKIHPERMFLNDLVQMNYETIAASSEGEYDQMFEKWSEDLTLFTP